MNTVKYNLDHYPQYSQIIGQVIDVRNELLKAFFFKDGLEIAIAGGSIVNCFLRKPINDYDIFANNPDLLKRNMDILSTIRPYIKKVCETDNACTYEFDGSINTIPTKVKIQAVKCRDIAEGVDQLFDTFDLINSCVALKDNEIIAHPEWLHLISTKELRVNKQNIDLDFAKTIQRMMDYATKGFEVRPEETGWVLDNLVSVDHENLKDQTNTVYVQPSRRVYNSRS